MKKQNAKSKQTKILEESKGITLIALVTTIIVLLILAGITISTIIGDGILIRSKETKKQAEIEALTDQVELSKLEAEKKRENPTLDNVIEELIENDVITRSEQVNRENGDITSDLGYVLEGLLDDYLKSPTEVEQPSEVHKFKVGSYVQLPYNNTTIECMVIYDDDYNEEQGTDYGIQMVTTDIVEKDVTLGYDVDVNDSSNIEERERKIRLAEESYNNAIITLNEEAEKYVNESNKAYVTSARSVGSVPDDPYSESEDYVEITAADDGTEVKVKIKTKDSNYMSDVKQLKNLDIYVPKSEKDYWFASRGDYCVTVMEVYGVYYSDCSGIDEWGDYKDCDLIYFFDGMNVGPLKSSTFKIRPVFTLNMNSNDKIYGSGTKVDPYRWTE